MNISHNSSGEHFRRGFVLALTLAYTTAFLAMLSGFFQTLLLAAVFSGVVYPLYQWLKNKLPGSHDTLASLLTLAVTLFAIFLPLLGLLGLVAEQAINVTKDLSPWLEQRLNSPAEQVTLPDWLPFADKLEPYQNEITAKLAEFAGTTGKFLAGILANLTQGTVSFFFQLFIMLYAMFFFLIDGPVLLQTILSYAPLSQGDKDKMLAVGLSVSRATIKGTLIIGIIQGTLGSLGFAVVGIKGAVFWGAIMAVLSALPGIGTALVWGPAVIYLLMSGQILAGVGLLAWSAIVVGSIDNFLRPFLVGRDTQMPDLLILLSTLGGLGLFGASGLILGPILAALFLTVLAIYSRVFADWLNMEQSSDDLPRDNNP